MLSRSEKEAIVSDLQQDIEKAQAVFLTNLIGISSNDAVALRKEVREANGKIVVTRNTLFERAFAGTASEELFKGLKGTNAVAIAFEDPAAIAKCIKTAGKKLKPVELRGGVLEGKQLSLEEVKALADLPSRDQMLGTLLATFMAPISAFARVLNAIQEQKEEGAPAEEVVSTEEAAPEQEETKTEQE